MRNAKTTDRTGSNSDEFKQTMRRRREGKKNYHETFSEEGNHWKLDTFDNKVVNIREYEKQLAFVVPPS